MRMELRHLRYFVAVASHGSFNRAAESLHVTQPPLSRQVKDLEEELGVTLLMRGTNSVKLTEAGERFYEEAREVLLRAEDAVRRVRGETQKQVLRVGYSTSNATTLVSAVLAKFQAAAPRVRIELADLSSRELNQMAGEGRLDIVISARVAVANAPGFHCWDLGSMQPVLVLPARHPLAKLKRIPIARLRNLPLLGLAKDHYPEYAVAVRDALRPHQIAPNFVALINDSFSTLFVELEARNAAAIVLEGITGMLPSTLVTRPLAPKLAALPLAAGLPVLHPKPHAEMFARLLMEEARSR